MDTPTPSGDPIPGASPPTGSSAGGSTRVAWIVVAVVAIVLLALLLSRCQIIKPITVAKKKTVVVATTGTIVPTTTIGPSESEPVTRTDFGQFNTASAGGTKAQVGVPFKVTVPNIVGLSLSAARSRVEARGLRFWPIPRPMGSKNHIWQQHPAPGTVVESGSDVQGLYGTK